MVCNKCGSYNEEGNKICLMCGSNLTDKQPGVTQGLNPTVNSAQDYIQNSVQDQMYNSMRNPIQNSMPNSIRPKKSSKGLLLIVVGVIAAGVFFALFMFFAFFGLRVDKDEKISQMSSKKSFNDYEIAGGWNSIEEDGTYWKFEDGQYWWYKSYDDLDDNYWHGNVELYTGKEGLELAGYDESKVEEIVDRSEGKIDEEDIYTLVCTPTKVITGGIDKSDTNIPEGQTLTYVWILVEYSDGIEAQVLDLLQSDVSYYLKIKE